MAKVEFFKQQAKRLLKDYNSRVFNEEESFFDYFPNYFDDIDEIVMSFEIDNDREFTLMNAQHVIAQLSGFYKWNELLKASESALEIGKLLLINRDNCVLVDEWSDYNCQYLENVDDKSKLEVFRAVFLGERR